MNRILSKAAAVLSVSLGLGLVWGSPAFAQLAKKGEFSVTAGYSMMLDKSSYGEFTFAYGDLKGAAFNDAGQGFLHNTSIHCRVVSDNSSLHGYCTSIDADGDSVHYRVERIGIQGDMLAPGKFQFVGGNGKYTGIKGSGNYVVRYVPSAAPGTAQGYVTFKGDYQLP